MVCSPEDTLNRLARSSRAFGSLVCSRQGTTDATPEFVIRAAFIESIVGNKLRSGLRGVSFIAKFAGKPGATRRACSVGGLVTQLGCMGGGRCLPPQHEAQRRRGQRQGRESEEGDGRATGRVREQPQHVRPHETAHVAERTYQGDARSRGGAAQKRR